MKPEPSRQEQFEVVRQMAKEIEGAVDTVVPPSAVEKPPMPRIKDIVLDQLRMAGEAGAKARPIREFIEKTYGVVIHEKTVGMSLYRLAIEGRARREGKFWFFVPPSAETKNPGTSMPGLVEEMVR